MSRSRIALCLIARSARGDVRWVAAVFVGADGTEKRVRLLLLQIGGANIENPPPSSSLAEEERLRSLLLHTAARDYRRSQLSAAAGSAGFAVERLVVDDLEWDFGTRAAFTDWSTAGLVAWTGRLARTIGRTSWLT